METAQQKVPPGLPDTSVVLKDALDRRWRNYRKALKRCQAKFSNKRVHQLRISLRRCIALLDALQVVVTEDDTVAICRCLSKQLNQLGPLRDAQNQMQYIKRLCGRSHPVPQALIHRLSKEEARMIKRACRSISKMDSGKLKRRMAALAKKLVPASDPPAAGMIRLRAHVVLTGRFADLVWRLSHARREDPGSVHLVRVALKKYRYLAEIWQPAFAPFDDAKLARMQALQDRLGEIQDLRVLQQMLADFKGGKEKEIAELRSRAQSRMASRMKDLEASSRQIFEFQPGEFEHWEQT